MSAYSKAYLRKVVQRFENAVDDYAFIGTIPAGENIAAAEAYAEVETEYARAKTALLRLLDGMNEALSRSFPA